MRPLLLLAFAAFSIASPALAAPAAPKAAMAAMAARDFRIAGEAFSQAEILDARGLATAGGEPAILITLVEKAWPRLAAISRANFGKPLSVTLNGVALNGPMLREAIVDGMVELTGFASFAESEKQAELISGKPPVPDSMEE